MGAIIAGFSETNGWSNIYDKIVENIVEVMYSVALTGLISILCMISKK